LAAARVSTTAGVGPKWFAAQANLAPGAGKWKSGVSLPYHLQVGRGDCQTVEIYSDARRSPRKDQKLGKAERLPPKGEKKRTNA
jgi:hypothetical protein